MKINVAENVSVQVLICLIVLLFFLGINYYIYKNRWSFTTPSAAYAGYASPGPAARGPRMTPHVAKEPRDTGARGLVPAVPDVRGLPLNQAERKSRSWVQELVRSVMQGDPSLHSASFIGPDGTVLAHTETHRLYTKLAHMNYFKEAMRGRNVSETLNPGNSPSAFRVVATPVNIDGEIVGVLCMTKTVPDTTMLSLSKGGASSGVRGG